MPLNNDAYLKSVGFPSTHIHCLDWWHSQLFTVTLPTQDGTITSSLEMTCTPSQHTSNRGLTDLQTALWGSWAIKQQTFVPESEGAQLYFGGDTGYRTVKYGEDENALPVNPEFAEIGRVFGGFDLALLPIGYALEQPYSILFTYVNLVLTDRGRCGLMSMSLQATVSGFITISKPRSLWPCTGGL